MTIELVSPFFSYADEIGKKLVYLFRKEIFEAVAKSDLYGMIYTCIWYFDDETDWKRIDDICKIFEDQDWVVYFVELEADMDERIERNKHPNRLAHKPTKRNIERSEKDLIDTMTKHRLNSHEGEIKRQHYIKINNRNLSPEEAAQKIKEYFQL